MVEAICLLKIIRNNAYKYKGFRLNSWGKKWN